MKWIYNCLNSSSTDAMGRIKHWDIFINTKAQKGPLLALMNLDQRNYISEMTACPPMSSQRKVYAKYSNTLDFLIQE